MTNQTTVPIPKVIGRDGKVAKSRESQKTCRIIKFNSVFGEKAGRILNMSFHRYSLIILLAGIFALQGTCQSSQRIVSLAPSLTRSLEYLEVTDRLIGFTSYCRTEQESKAEIVASAIRVNLEKVISLRPDLVITTTITDPETIASLQKFGIRVEVFNSPVSFKDICDQFVALGEMVGRKSLADSIVAASRKTVHDLKQKVTWQVPPRIFFQIGAKPLFTVIPETFMDDYIRLCGGINIAAGMKHGTITRETVLKENPDVIFIVTMGITGYEEKRIWESYSSMNASRDGKIYILDSDLACTPTPITFAQTLCRMLELLNDQNSAD